MSIPENIKEKLLPSQIINVTHLIKLIKAGRTVVLNGSDPGTGKTHEICAMIACLNLNPIPICPKSVIPHWYNTCSIYGVTPLGVVNYETLKNGKYYPSLNSFYNEERDECPWLKISRKIKTDINGQISTTASGRPKKVVSNITWNLPENSICIFDEAHRGKNGLNSGKTLNSKLMVSIRPFLSAESKRYGAVVSATITDKDSNFDVVGYMLGLYQPYTKQTFTQFMTRISVQYGGNTMLGLHKTLYPKYGVRSTIAGIKKKSGNTIFKENDIKAKAYIIDTTTAMQIEYLHQEIEHELNQIRSKGITRGFGYIIRCWQKIEVLKAPHASSLICKKYNKSMSVVVFICFKATKRLILNKIAESIPIEQIGFIDGDQTPLERQEIVERFQNDELRVLICQIIAGGESLSFHDTRGVHQRFTLLFPTWSAISMVQALGRTYRAGSKSDSIQRIYYIKPKTSTFGKTKAVEIDSIEDEESEFMPIIVTEAQTTRARVEQTHLTMEEKICANVNIKRENIEMLNDGQLSGIDLF